MKSYKGRQSGFTLIELMIASSLLMLIMYSGYYAYSLYSSSWQKQSTSFWVNTKEGLNLTLLSRLLESAKPYIVDDINERPSIYFLADPRSVKFISSSPIFSASEAVVELVVADDNLIYREMPLNTKALLKQSDSIEWQHSIVLLHGVSNASFRYYGWNNLAQIKDYELQQMQQLRGEAPITPNWYDRHQMEVKRILPIYVLFSYEKGINSTSELSFKMSEYSQYSLFRYLREDI